MRSNTYAAVLTFVVEVTDLARDQWLGLTRIDSENW